MDLKTKVERLIDKYNLSQNQVGLCYLYGEYYEAAKIFQNNGIFPKAIITVFDNEKGINNTGTFHFICRECDGKYFKRVF